MSHLADYRLPAFLILIAFIVVYAVWFRRIVLDIPIALRFLFSAVPAFVLYRSVISLRMLLFYGARPLNTRFSQPWLLGFFTTVIGVAGLVLYHIWRDVNRGDPGGVGR